MVVTSAAHAGIIVLLVTVALVGQAESRTSAAVSARAEQNWERKSLRVAEAAVTDATMNANHSRLVCTHKDTKLAEESFLRDPNVLQAFITAIPVVFPARTWLQIGANTLDPKGASYQVEDPLLHYLPMFSQYRKVFVEPVPPLFEQLKMNTRSFENTDLVNAAIVPQGGGDSHVTMFCPPEEDMQQWLVGICSMDEKVILTHVPGKKAREFKVQALTVSDLFKAHNIHSVEIVMIDTEGYDVQILKMLPFHSPDFRPSLVVFEHTEISPQEWEIGKEYLRSQCYMLAYDRENTYGLRMVAGP